MSKQALNWQESPAIGATQAEFDTPCVVVDLDSVEQNIEAMVKRLAQFPSVSIRPHLKTAKNPQFAKMMLESGARGICVAKISEAEVFFAAGITDILITTEIAGQPKIDRLINLASACRDLRIVLDNADVAAAIDQACAKALKHKLKVLIDFNVGQNRTGVETLTEALSLADSIAKLKHLELIGIQGYEGHLQHLEAIERESRCRAAMKRLKEVADALRKNGHSISCLTTGGTGTAEICASCDGVTEVQPGSFIFMDTSYYKATDGAFQHALSVYATVVSSPNDTQIVVDAGTKSLSVDMGFAQVAGQPEWDYVPGGDEHGIIKAKSGALNLVPGDRVELLPSHIDTTIALHDFYHVMRGGKLEGIWPIATRGKVQ